MKTARTLCTSLLLAAAALCASFANAGQQPSFAFHELPLRATLDSLMRLYAVSIVFLDQDVEGTTVSASCEACDLQGALNAVLKETSLMWIITGNQVILKHRPETTVVPKSDISGFVTDSLTGTPIGGAMIRLERRNDEGTVVLRGWCPTNNAGFFALRRIPAGVYTLSARIIGYHAKEMELPVRIGESLKRNIPLGQDEIRLQEVTVEGQRVDLSAASGLTQGIYIPSSPSNQNEYFLDGTRIYNPSHFGGILTTFNSDALNDVRVLTGGLPSSYGGAIGGLLDLSLRDGVRDRLSGAAGTGTLGSSISLEGPVGKSVSYLLSGRREYPNPAVPFLDRIGTPSRQGSWELIAKLSDMFSSSSRVYLSGYLGRDLYNNQVDMLGQHLENRFSWGNSSLNLRWAGIALPSLFLQISAVYTRYDMLLDQGLSLPGVPYLPRDEFTSEYSIEDLGFRATAEHYYDLEHTFSAGVELTRHRLAGKINSFSSQMGPAVFDGSSIWEFAVFFQDQWRLLPELTAELGARATSFSGEQGTESSVDPRFSLLYVPVPETKLFASFTTVNQFLHPYRNSGVYLLYPSIFWYPSGDKVQPSTSLQVRAGAERSSADNNFTVSLSGYYQVIQHLHEFRFDTTIFSTRTLSDQILSGTGKSYGLELTLSRRLGDFNGRLAYTLSWGNNQFSELNGGAPYPLRFDRRHEMEVSASYAATSNLTFSVLAVLALESVGTFAPSAPKAGRVIGAYNGGAAASSTPAWLIDLNGDKYPGFQRLEFSVHQTFSLVELPCMLSLRLVNAYGLIDPFAWKLQPSPDIRTRWSADVQELKLFPLFPTVALSVRF